MFARGVIATGLLSGAAAAQEAVWRPASPAQPAAIEFRPVKAGFSPTRSAETEWRPSAVPPTPTPSVITAQAVVPVPAAPVEVHATPVNLKPIPQTAEPPRREEKVPDGPDPNPLPILKPAAARAPTPAPAPPGASATQTPAAKTATTAPAATTAGTAVLFETETPATRFAVRPEFLYWWYNRGSVPVLASTGPGFGYLDDLATTPLLGPGGFGPGSAPGFRVRGSWEPTPLLSLDAGYFFLGRQAKEVGFGSEYTATVARPVYAVNFGSEYAELTSFPGLSSGSLAVRQSSELWGAELNAKRGSFFAGYRHLNMTEDLTFAEVVVAGASAPQPVGTRVNTNESFGTTNRFHGGQVGWAGATYFGRVNFDARTALAFGVTRQTIDIQGEQRVLRPNEPETTYTGGLLAAGPNLGRQTQDRFSVVPEAGVGAGLDLSPGVRVFCGYNVIAWTAVARPGNQIDRSVDLAYVPNAPAVTAGGERRPVVPFDSTTFWAQGMQVGLDVRW